MAHFGDQAFAEALNVSYAKPSPDGLHILYEVAGKNLEEDREEGWLWVYNTATGSHRQLTFEHRGGDAAWLDNETVIYSALLGSAARHAAKHEGEPLTAFYTQRVDGGGAQELFRVPVNGARAESIDGNRFLVYGRERVVDEQDDPKLYTIFDEFPMHADGDHFGKTSKWRSRIWMHTLSTGNFEALTPPLFQNRQRMRINLEPLLSADKRHLYFVGQEFSSRMKRATDVWVLDLETLEYKLVFRNDKYLLVRTFEFEGRVWFLGISLLGKDFYGTDLISPMPGSDEYKVELATDATLTQIGVDGDQLLLVFAEHSSTNVYAWSPGKTPELIGTPEHAIEEKIFKAGDQWYYVGRKHLGLRQLIAWNGSESSAVTDVGAEFLQKYPFSPCEEIVVDFEDGHKVYGWVMKPHNYDPNKTYPGLLMIHGGPQGAYTDKLILDVQRYNAEGWFVYYCNPRGSTNYGRAHMDLAHKWGTIDYEDIMAFNDAVLAANPQIDADRLGVIGGSYGGYMTNWVIGHTNRFKAAVTIVTISNHISMFGTSDLPFFILDMQGSKPWEDIEPLWNTSPLKFAGNIETPTLIIQNDEDYRCPVEQAEQFLSTLLMRDIPARMILFHGVPHSVWSPKQQERKFKETVAWFHRFLD